MSVMAVTITDRNRSSILLDLVDLSQDKLKAEHISLELGQSLIESKQSQHVSACV